MTTEPIVTTPPTNPPPPAPDAPWFQGADQETTGFVQNRGWDKLTAKDAAIAAVKSYREAAAHIGVPPDQILRMPKDRADQEGWNKVYSRLGVPDKPEAYDFKDVKFADGSDLDQEIVNTVRKVAHENHMTPEAAAAMARTIVSMADAAEQTERDQYTFKLQAERQELNKDWGSRAATNLVIAQNAAAKFGVTQEVMQNLEKAMGYKDVMNFFLNVGMRVGEPGFVQNGNGNVPGVMTQAQAKASLEALESDTQFKTKLFDGDLGARQQFDNLTRIASGYMG